jgi:hypothetical protein
MLNVPLRGSNCSGGGAAFDAMYLIAFARRFVINVENVQWSQAVDRAWMLRVL